MGTNFNNVQLDTFPQKKNICETNKGFLRSTITFVFYNDIWVILHGTLDHLDAFVIAQEHHLMHDQPCWY